MIHHPEILHELLRRGADASAASLAEAAEETLIHADTWVLLALRGQWPEPLLQQLAVADWSNTPDHKRWARKIIARIATGDRGVTQFQARAALEALCSPSEGAL